ncbi:MAG: M4 family metallopeptidase [Chitinophagales bacterium]|nr:peptidase M4 family protein [Bacteroidota bacterium]MCB9042342.1 peptidase M4 family protein [Chitinophagales bacterium]
MRQKTINNAPPTTLAPIDFHPNEHRLRNTANSSRTVFGTLQSQSFSVPAQRVANIIGAYHDPQTDLPIFLQTSISFPKSNISDKESVTLALNALSDALPQGLKTEDISFDTSSKDELGYTHLKLQQNWQGVPIFGAEATLHYNLQGNITLNGRLQTPPQEITSTNPALDASNAYAIAKNDLSAKTTWKDLSEAELAMLHHTKPKTELVILPTNNFVAGPYKLAWHVQLKPNFVEWWDYFIDAQSGEILNQYNHTCNLVGPATASGVDLNGITQTVGVFKVGSTYYMYDTSKDMYTGNTTEPQAGDGVIVTLDFQNNTTSNPQFSDISSGNNTWSPLSISAHYNAGKSYDYFRNTHNWKSIDGQGGDIVSFVNVADDNGGGLDNAFWNGEYMFYGNGNVAFTKLAGGLDVGAHEMGHGVIQNTANLIYQGQAGAINEHFADVFGVMVDRNDWALGEDVVKTQIFPTGKMRDMANPHNGGTGLNSNGWQPANMSEIYSGSQDNGGVHINSGIVNYAFYLFATATSKEVGEKVYFRALSQYLTKSSQFIDLRLAIIQAATDLYGASSNEVQAAKSAFDQVGIGNGQGGDYQTDIDTNTGQEYILCLDTSTSDPNTLYLSNTSGNSFTPLTTTGIYRKPSVTDDGSLIFFVGDDNNIHAIDLTENPIGEYVLTNDNYWSSVAISKDGKRLAAIPDAAIPYIYVYDFDVEDWAEYQLYNPTTGTGGQTVGGVQYADAFEWDYSGEYVVYDAYNQIDNNLANDNLDYWDMGILHAWSNSSNNYADGQIYKIFSDLAEGESIGNPVLAKNSPYILAFDYFNADGDAYVLATNLETGDIGAIFQNNDLGYASYSADDNKVVFTTENNGQEVIGVINMQADKINSSGNASLLIGEAKWPYWFAQGERDFTGIENTPANNSLWKLSPLPATEQVWVNYPNTLVENTLQVKVCNLLGETLAQYTQNVTPQSKGAFSVDITKLPAGQYFIQVSNKNTQLSFNFQKM